MDLIGRKTTLQLIFIPFAVAWTVIGFAVNVEMLYIGTFIAGVAAGEFGSVSWRDNKTFLTI